MSRTVTRIGEPARYNDWGLTVDSMAHPTEYVVLRYTTWGRRHEESFEEIARLPYESDPRATLVERTAMPKGTASMLATRLAVKLASPRAAMADVGYRPVV